MKKVILLIVLALASHLIYLLNFNFIMKEREKQDTLKNTIAQENLKNSELKALCEQLSAPSRIYEIALNQLYMILPEGDDQVAYVKKSEINEKEAYVLLDHISPSLDAMINN